MGQRRPCWIRSCRTFLRAWRDGELPGVVGLRASAATQPGGLRSRTSTTCLRSIRGALGRRPPELAELLTDLALGSPAILAARSLKRRVERPVLTHAADWACTDRGRILAPLQSTGGNLAAAPTGAGYRRPRRVGLLASRPPLLPAGKPAGGAGRAVAHAVGSGVLDGGFQRRRDRREVRPQARPDGEPDACPLVSTDSSFRPSEGRPEQRVDREELRVSAPCSPCGSATVRADDGAVRQPGRRPRHVQRPVPAVRARQHIDRAGRDSISIPGATA